MIIIQYKKLGNWINLDPFYVNAEVENTINAYASFSFDYPLGNLKTADLQQRVEIQILEGGDFVVGGYIDRVEKSFSNSGLMAKITCQNYLLDFTNEISVPNKAYLNEEVSDLLNPAYPNTVVRPSGWSTVVEATTEDFTYLSSLQTSLSIFQQIGLQTGFNFRYAGTTLAPKTIEFGKFGQSNGVRIRRNPINYTSTDDNVLVVDESGLAEVVDSGGVINQVYPLGGGGDNGVNQLTLRDVEAGTIVAGYPVYIDSDTPNNDVVYDPSVFSNTVTGPNNYQAFYLKDQDSQDTYGVIKRPITFNDIYPLSDNGSTFTDADRKVAANQLYKAARWFLVNHAEAHLTYRFSCYGDAPDLRVGDKVNFRYKGEIKKIDQRSNTSLVFVDIDEDFYVVSFKISWGANNEKKYELELSNYPRRPSSDADVISDAIESIQDASRQRKGSVTTYPVYFEDSFDSANPAQFLYWIPPQTTYLDYIQLKVRIKPFRAYEQATLGGGSVASTSEAGGGAINSSGGGGNHTHDVTIPSHTHGISASTTNSEGTGTGAHQHRIQVIGDSASDGSLAALGYKYLMVLPGAGSTMGACSGVTGGYLVASSAGGLINSLSLKTDCTISGHNHSISAFATNSGGGAVTSSNASGNHTHTVTIPSHTHGFSLPNHTHAIQFGIYEDPTIATGIKIFIDGIDFSSQLGIYSSAGDYPSGLNDNFDLLAAAEALGVLNTVFAPGSHTIEVRCSANRAKAQLFIYNQFYLSSK